MLKLLQNTLIAHGVPKEVAQIIEGAVIVAALWLQRHGGVSAHDDHRCHPRRHVPGVAACRSACCSSARARSSRSSSSSSSARCATARASPPASTCSSFTGDTAKYGLVALGMTFVIMTGGIDLSVGSVAALGGVVAVKVSEHGLLPGLLAGIAAGAAVGRAQRLADHQAPAAAVHRHAGHPAGGPRARAQPGRHPGGGRRARRLPEARRAGPCSACRSRRGRCSSPSSSARRCCDYTAGAAGSSRSAATSTRPGSWACRWPAPTFSVYVLSGALAGCAGVFLGSQNGSVDTAAGQGWELSRHRRGRRRRHAAHRRRRVGAVDPGRRAAAAADLQPDRLRERQAASSASAPTGSRSSAAPSCSSSCCCRCGW